MRILLIEDNDYKANDITETLVRVDVTDITRKEAINESLRELNEQHQKNNDYDCIILDMQFPRFKNQMPEANAGMHILKFLERRHITTPVIVCSSDILREPTDNPNIKKIIQYNPCVSLTSTFYDLLTGLKTKKKETK